MPKITFERERIQVMVPTHANLREVAVANKLPIYAGAAKFVNCHGNGNASSFGVVFDIGNTSTGLRNKVTNSSFDGFNGATSIDINVNNSAMSKTFIGNDNTFDSADTLSISDSGTATVIENTTHTQTGALVAGTATVTFPGNGFINANAYNCQVRDTTTPANAITLGTFTATTVVLTGTGTDNYSLTCNGQHK